MDRQERPKGLPYQARVRLAGNLFLQRKRAGLSQEALARRAMVCATRIGAIESGQSAAMLTTYVRLAGSLGVSLDDLLAGVSWSPSVVELEYDAGYEIRSEVEIRATLNCHTGYRPERRVFQSAKYLQIHSRADFTSGRAQTECFAGSILTPLQTTVTAVRVLAH